ncbi:cation channel sperm-associated auxiliary subunit epsilon isoform X1 [Monodelphis domestica]|uniref:cation channel sperm-associated auxiliary subunit epsilon isoform X1 n=2 Tax=Monodelphis domestica TaxID=13616 RepID=UPI0024E258E8|nr:cation channel sperm-associated auxiliary subunit epsilon isoform X1 [Monodelphis domestica]
MFCGKVLVALVLLLNQCFALWRYKTNSMPYSIFSTRTTIHLEYTGTGFTEWETPAVCSVGNKTSKTTVMNCANQGTHRIRPLVANQDPELEERFLFVERSSDCFLWYLQSNSVEGDDSQHIQIWIYDPENSSPSELEQTAGLPSMNSKTLSMQFISMGQEPVFQSIINHVQYFPKTSEQEGVWEIKIPHISQNMFMTIKGNSVAFQDCFIADYTFILSYSKLYLVDNPDWEPLGSESPEYILYDWPPCFPASIVAVSFWETLFTKDSFNTSQKVRAPRGYMPRGYYNKVTSVAMVDEGLLFLIKGKIYLRRDDLFSHLDSTLGIPDNVLGIGTRTWCWPDYKSREGLELSQMVMWTKSEVYVLYSHLKFNLLATAEDLLKRMRLSPSMESSMTVKYVTYTSDPTGIAILIAMYFGNKNDSLYLVSYNEDSYEWILEDFEMFVPHNRRVSVLFMFSALPNFVIWDDYSVYYSYRNHSKTGFLETKDGLHNLSAATMGSTIHQVFIDYYGNALIKMYNNVMLYFKIEITDVEILHQWTKEDDRCLIIINPSEDLFLLTFNQGTTTLSEYPLVLELYSSTFKSNIQCPYMLFESSIYFNNVYMDKRTELTFWCQVVYPENLGLFSIVEVYGPKILKEKRSTSYEIALGICTKNLTVTLYQDVKYENVENYYQLQEENTGHMMIQLRPSQFSKICPLSSQAVHVFVGCFPQRHIVVKEYDYDECKKENITYTIEKEFLRGNATENKNVSFDTQKNGCPLRISMRSSFHPTLLLYDADVFVEEVTTNFIVREIHGRMDFTFNLTMKESGCVNEAQTWDSMLEKNKYLPIEEVWGPQNYKDCFTYSVGKPGDLSKPYEILNMSNKNFIIFNNPHLGMYVFEIKILDPNYSFCNLKAIFAIETFGETPNLVFSRSTLLVAMPTSQDTAEGLTGKNASHVERKNYGSRNAKAKHMTSHHMYILYI